MNFITVSELVNELGLSQEGAQAIYDGITRRQRLEQNKRWGVNRLENLSTHYQQLMEGRAKHEAWEELVSTSTLELNMIEGKDGYVYKAWEMQLQVINDLRNAGIPPNSFRLRSAIADFRIRSFKYIFKA